MTPEFEQVFAALKGTLKKHERTLFVLKDEPQEYTLGTKSNSNRGMKMWFGGVRAGADRSHWSRLQRTVDLNRAATFGSGQRTREEAGN